MLDDSVPYKTQFIEELDDIVSICISSDADNVKLERFVFWVAFTVRKLSEASKLSDELESEPVVIDRYQRNNTDGCYDNLNWFKIETFYRLGTSEELTIAPIWLCHQLIHSFVFLPALY